MGTRLKSGFWYALVAFPLLEAGIAGPNLFHLSQFQKQIAFLSCLGLAVAFLVTGAFVERGEVEKSTGGRNRRRMIAISGMMVSGISFVGFAGTYFWPTTHSGSQSAARSISTDGSVGGGQQLKQLSGNLLAKASIDSESSDPNIRILCLFTNRDMSPVFIGDVHLVQVIFKINQESYIQKVVGVGEVIKSLSAEEYVSWFETAVRKSMMSFGGISTNKKEAAYKIADTGMFYQQYPAKQLLLNGLPNLGVIRLEPSSVSQAEFTFQPTTLQQRKEVIGSNVELYALSLQFTFGDGTTATRLCLIKGISKWAGTGMSPIGQPFRILPNSDNTVICRYAGAP